MVGCRRIAAPDAHAKNYSIFLGPTGVEALSPLYDVSTGLGYPDSSELAMGFVGVKVVAKVTGRHLLAFARDVGIDGELVLEAARAMAAIMPLAFASAVMDTCAVAGVSTGDVRWLNRTTDMLSEHCRRVQTRLERTA